MGKKSQLRMTGLDEEGRIKRSNRRKAAEEKAQKEMEIELAKKIIPKLLTTPFQPLVPPDMGEQTDEVTDLPSLMKHKREKDEQWKNSET